MRIWVTKNSEVPVHEQLVRQIMLGILSEELGAGDKLPSIRGLARRYKIHSNTVSAAYHELRDRGWLELRRGSGLYVRAVDASGGEAHDLDVLLADLLRTARSKGHEPRAVLERLEQMVRPRKFARVVVIDTDPGMDEILQAEIRERVTIPVETIGLAEASGVERPALAVALATRAELVRDRLAGGARFMILRLRSVRGALEGNVRPAADAIVAIVSRSADFRRWAHAMLVAVGLDPDCLLDVDTGAADWRERARTGKLVITDLIAARELPQSPGVRVFRVIADSCLDELRELCDA